MTRMTVLASGSSGNCTFVGTPSFGFLLDLGLGPRRLAKRFGDCGDGVAWNAVRAVLLTHTHSDHWNEASLSKLLHFRIPLYCHPEHIEPMRRFSPMFQKLLAADLVGAYQANTPWQLDDGVTCQALPVRHDSGATFGFRIELAANLVEPALAIAYAADLGTWDAELVDGLRGADILALEFNHDVGLQRASGRPPDLIARVLGDEGHLSNDQAAGLLERILTGSTQGRLRHLVQLHLSRQCNRPSLAQQAARSRLVGVTDPPRVHTASQDYVTVVRDTPAVSAR